MNRPIHHTLIAFLAVVITWGCAPEQQEIAAMPQMPTEPREPSPQEPGVLPPASQTTNEAGEQTYIDTPDLIEEYKPKRVRKRLNIDQLGNAILSATGGLKWVQDNDDDLLQTLAFTLGKPDYLEVTAEDLGSTVLFMKFLEDAAGSVCRQMVERDQAEETEVLVNSSVSVEEHVSSLLLRFHHRQLSEQHPDLKQWVWLYETAMHISQSETEAWRTVCVGLIRHPDFYTY